MTKNIRFSARHQADFAAELRAQVKSYFESKQITEYGNFSIVAKTLVMAILYFTPYVFMLTGLIESPWLVLLSWSMMGIGMAGIGMGTMHDANHGSFSKNKTVNKWLSRSMYLLGGFAPNWRHQHNTMHHRYTNVDGMDEDIAPVGILRFSPHKPLKRMHRYQHWYAWFFYGLMTISWVTNKDFKQLFRYRREGVKIDRKQNYGALIGKLLTSKILYYVFALVLPLLLIQTAWYWIVGGFLLMHFICGFLLGVIFQTAHVMPDMDYPLPDEEGQIDNNWLIHQLQTTSNYSPKSKWFSWLIGGLNYQVEHHLFPGISHVHYKDLAVLVQTTAGKYQLPYHVQPNFFKAVKNHYLMLKSLGR